MSRQVRIMSEQRLGEYNPKRISADYSMIAADTVVVGDLAAGSFTITLPSVVEAPGVPYTFRVNGTVVPHFMQVVDRGDSISDVEEILNNDSDTLVLISNGTDWMKGV